MAATNPSAVTLNVNAWTLIASNTNKINIYIKMFEFDTFYSDFRLQGNTAPTDLSTAILLDNKFISQSFSSNIDFYLYSTTGGSVIVSTI